MKVNETSDDELHGIYGAGGFGREVAQMVQNSFLRHSEKRGEKRLMFIESSPKNSATNGIPIVSEDEFFTIPAKYRMFTIAIAASAIRRRLAAVMIERGATPISVISHHSIIDSSAVIGDGAIIAPFVSVNANASIGAFFHANMYSYVAHDSIIGDFVTLAPRVAVNGNVHIANDVFIGTSAVIKEGSESVPLKIGEGASIGMGALVSKPVDQWATVVGYPARMLPIDP